MRWFGVSGSWRLTNDRVRRDVVQIVRKIVAHGDGIVTGGALGVDYFAAEAVFEYGDPRKQLKIVLPVKLASFVRHFLRRAREGVITSRQAEEVIAQWKALHTIAPKNIIDKTVYNSTNEESYLARNQIIVDLSDELYAFQVNKSHGVGDAVKKARKAKKKIHLKRYSIRKNKIRIN